MSEFHEQVIRYAKDWRQWFPDDPVKQLLKKAIDKTQHQLNNDD